MVPQQIGVDPVRGVPPAAIWLAVEHFESHPPHRTQADADAFQPMAFPYQQRAQRTAPSTGRIQALLTGAARRSGASGAVRLPKPAQVGNRPSSVAGQEPGTAS